MYKLNYNIVFAVVSPVNGETTYTSSVSAYTEPEAVKLAEKELLCWLNLADCNGTINKYNGSTYHIQKICGHISNIFRMIANAK